MKTIIICLTLFVSTLAYGDRFHTLHGNIRQMAGRKIELLDFYGKKNSVIDSCVADDKGIFEFRLNEGLPTGMYRLRFAKGKFVDIIYNHHDIRFTLLPSDSQAGFYSVADNIEISQSEENKLYYGFLRLLEHDRQRLNLLNQLNALYKQERGRSSGTNEHAPFYKRIEEEVSNIQESQKVYAKQLISRNPQTFAAKIVNTLRNPVPDRGTSVEKQKEFIRDHFFDMVDFDEVSLIRSSVIPVKIWTYFDLYRNSGFINKEQQEEAFIKAVDVVMSEAEINDTMFDFVLDIITRRFEKSDYELVFTYITENYVLADSCKNENNEFDHLDVSGRRDELKDKIERIKKLAIGKTAPEIIMDKLDGDRRKMTDIKSECTLILFWASWCRHCGVILPQVKEIYDEYRDKGLEVLAISIDKDKDAWMKAVASGNYNWINYSDQAGWDSKPAMDYNVWATPKMYLLDKEKRIIAKPLTVDELEEIVIPRLLSKSG
ncbi:MAG: thioredoxin-like domain-containing protein [Candidatus Anammoxibacter sp.]